MEVFMGYTHYWESKTGIPADVWEGICEDAKQLTAAFSSPIRDLTISKLEIFFNGDCESFELTRAPVWECCKTRREPYDKLVCAVLAVAAQRFPELNVGSDALWEGDESLWDSAMEWAGKVLGRDVPKPWK